MDYCEFVQVIETELNKMLKMGVRASIYTATKNNNKKRTGVVMESPGINISPTIYLEEFYRRYNQGKTIEEIVSEIITFYNQVRYEQSWELSTIEDYERVRHRIILKLVNTERNRELLKKVPHLEYLDLSILFCVLIEKNDESTATMLIQKEQMSYWGVNECELYQHAVENVNTLLPPQLIAMEQLIREMMRTEPVKKVNLLETHCEAENDSMYVLTNSIRSMGASCIVYPGILDRISAVFQSGFYVLPSSVHEMILIPDAEGNEMEKLSKMVKEVNETQVEEEEILSDQVYYYDCVQRRMRMNFQ